MKKDTDNFTHVLDRTLENQKTTVDKKLQSVNTIVQELQQYNTDDKKHVLQVVMKFLGIGYTI